MKLYWCGSSRFHDWSADGRAIPRRLLARAREAGLIGPVDAHAMAPDEVRTEAGGDERALEWLLDQNPRPGRPHGFTAEGSRPGPWDLGMQLPPWLPEEKRAQAYNILNLWFEDGRFPGEAGSEALVRTFRAMHGPENSEAAYIHPYEQWVDLTDAFDGAYAEPLTATPIFPGVMWVNFLGRGQLDLFDVAKLRKLEAHQLDWIGKDGLFLRVCADVRDAVRPEMEKEMVRLTDQMRRALR